MLTGSIHFLIVSPPIFASASWNISVHVSEFLLPRFVFGAVVNYLTAVVHPVLHETLFSVFCPDSL